MSLMIAMAARRGSLGRLAHLMSDTLRAPRRRSSRWATSRAAITMAMIEQEKVAAWLVAPRSSSRNPETAASWVWG
jgi:hypothetical protein